MQLTIDHFTTTKRDTLRVGDIIHFAGGLMVVTARETNGDWIVLDVHDGVVSKILNGPDVWSWRVIGHVPHVAEARRLDELINNPHTDDFLESVRTEAAHQRERWGAEHDAGKDAPDWFWLLGYLAGKALHAWKSGNKPKLLHHIVTAGAALLNWHAHETGASTSMRPGIEPPEASDAP